MAGFLLQGTLGKLNKSNKTHTHTHSKKAYSESDYADDGQFGAIVLSHSGWSSDVITRTCTLVCAFHELKR